jgi:hypothetical protein
VQQQITNFVIRLKNACLLRDKCYITRMARGESGRIVIEIDPEVKRRLYAALALTGSTLKDWFVQSALDFCSDAEQPRLFPKEDLQSGDLQSSAWVLNDKPSKG